MLKALLGATCSNFVSRITSAVCRKAFTSVDNDQHRSEILCVPLSEIGLNFFPLRYTFGCRQVAIDNSHKVISFDLYSVAKNLLSIGAQTTVAVVSTTMKVKLLLLPILFNPF